MPRSEASRANGPLWRFRVLDLPRARAGPTAVRQLADWGADVIKIEMPPGVGDEQLGGDRDGFDFQNLHRNKRSITLNLKEEGARQVFLKLCRDADVLIENFRPDVKHRLKIDYETVRAVNPRIVYGSISGFGQKGPYSNRAGLDQIAQGLGGLMSVTGLPGQGPVRVGIPIADLSSGFNLAMGVLIALLEREESGEGQWVHTSLLEAQITMMDLQAARYLMAGQVPGQAGNNHPTGIPTGVFATADGQINIQASAQHLFKRMCATIGGMHIYDNPDYADQPLRSKNRDRINAEITACTKTKTSDEWVELLNEAGVPCGPILKVDQVFANPQVQTLNMDPAVEHPRLGRQRVVGQAVKMNRTPQVMRGATPDIGEHTDAVLAEHGYSAEESARMRSESLL